MAKIKIWSDGRYEQGAKLDGEDISRAIKGIEFSMEVGVPAEVRLDLAVFEMEVDAEDAKVHLTNAARDLLIRSGWRAPEDES